MTTYNWTIDKLHTKDITKNGTTYTDVILRVEATLIGTSATIGSVTSTSGFDLDMNTDGIDNSFTTYSSVTEENVKTWVENRVSSEIMANVKDGIESNIDFQEKVHGATPKGTTDADGNFIASFPWS